MTAEHCRLAMICLSLLATMMPSAAHATREAVLKQVQLPHGYYWRELYLPQLTSGPSAADFTPDGTAVIYSMGGSLWRQGLAGDNAEELTSGPGYDYQPDVSPDGKQVVFARQYHDSIELVERDLASGAERSLTADKAVAVEPRYSPDGKQVLYVSTRDTGRFGIWLADVGSRAPLVTRRLIAEQDSTLNRYYYVKQDHAINPSWSADGKQVYFVSNRGVAWGTGDIWSVAVDRPDTWTQVLREETSWSARPEMSPDGKRLLYSSYQGRQWHQLWLTTPTGDSPLPLTFGEFDRRNARWSADGEKVLYISNETGNTSLWVHDAVGGERRQIVAKTRQWRRAMARLDIELDDAAGEAIAGRVSVLGGDGRHYAATDAWVRGDDLFDRAVQDHETHYFHCDKRCSVDVPVGKATLTAVSGLQREALVKPLRIAAQANQFTARLADHALPAEYGPWISLDQHVHMNYGGHYRNTRDTLMQSARAEDLDVVYNLTVNKEQRVNDIAEFQREPQEFGGATLIQAQEYHTSYWGHMALLHLDDHLLMPSFSAYRHTALTSPYPHNGVVAQLAHRQNAVVGYVHPFDTPIRPVTEKSLSNMLPADAALGNIDYMEVVSFADHLNTAEVWHRLLNLGYRLPAGAGTDAMANYASMRGPIGLNRLMLNQRERTTQALRDGIRSGHSFVTNGPLLGFTLDGKRPGEVVSRTEPGEVSYRAALRSTVPLQHVEVLVNGKVAAILKPDRDGRDGDFTGSLKLQHSGWVLLRAYGEPHALVMDIYPYASTNPVWIEIGGKAPRAPEDAAYFVAWMDRVISDASARQDYNTARERSATLDYLRTARQRFAAAL